ncbi:hypothetical protein KW837_26660 [Pseudomonas sp. PDM24]|uniref:hypothetical protein n=1 Tax=Pseudomonas sp. PDM24 TaxID=2854777 RepID=UPI001C48205E|nr:hypothetical protein [Pseudomonas sp. PDM24]MBV7497856.1 hypothetical protein [Pseudomonas sp. PDM24]
MSKHKTKQPFFFVDHIIPEKKFSAPAKTEFVYSDTIHKYEAYKFTSSKHTSPERFHEDWAIFMENVSCHRLDNLKKCSNSINTNTKPLTLELKCFVDSTPIKFQKAQWSWYFDEIIETINTYFEEATKEELPFAPPSLESLTYFLRYIPFFADTKAKSYIDRMTGRFGIILHKNKNILDIQIREDSDIVFSYATPGLKKSFPSFSGEAVVIDSIDSRQIQKLLRIAYD